MAQRTANRLGRTALDGLARLEAQCKDVLVDRVDVAKFLGDWPRHEPFTEPATREFFEL